MFGSFSRPKSTTTANSKKFVSDYGTGYGLKRALAGTDVCETQNGVLCGQHAINNLLQEKKIVSLKGNNNLFVSGSRNENYTNPDGSCYSLIDVLNRKDIKINMKVVCKFDPTEQRYCDKAGYYIDDSFEYVLHNILRYTYEFAPTQGGVVLSDWIEMIKTKLSNEFVIGLIINLGNGHWTCLTKGMASSSDDRPYVYLDSYHSDHGLFLSHDELNNFFNEVGSTNLGCAIISYSDGRSYKSIASEYVKNKRNLAVAARVASLDIQYDRFAKYVKPITRLNYVYGQASPTVSDILKKWKSLPGGPQTSQALLDIATREGFPNVVISYLSDFDNKYPGAAAAPAAPSKLVARPKPVANISKASKLVAPPKPVANINTITTLVAPPPPSKQANQPKGLLSRISSAIGFGTTAPVANDERLKEFSKLTGESINNIKAAYSPDQLKKYLNEIIGTKAPVAAPIAPAKAPVAAPTTVIAKAPAAAQIVPAKAQGTNAKQAAIKAKREANIARAKKLGLFGGTRKIKRSRQKRQSRKNK